MAVRVPSLARAFYLTDYGFLDFAGATTVFAETCSGVCYNDFVLGNGSNYDTAYFEVASVRVFSKEGTTTIVQGSAAPRTVPAAALGVVLSTLVAAAVSALL